MHFFLMCIVVPGLRTIFNSTGYSVVWQIKFDLFFSLYPSKRIIIYVFYETCQVLYLADGMESCIQPLLTLTQAMVAPHTPCLANMWVLDLHNGKTKYTNNLLCSLNRV